MFNKKDFKKLKKNLFFFKFSLKSSCCIDFVGAQHLNYDFIIHFGRACFSEGEKSD
jgi:diphthamide biosynthesis enzyme Dph1/Dph2-like protein